LYVEVKAAATLQTRQQDWRGLTGMPIRSVCGEGRWGQVCNAKGIEAVGHQPNSLCRGRGRRTMRGTEVQNAGSNRKCIEHPAAA
jgi:hypothetical protein